jgi:hypothetical protein
MMSTVTQSLRQRFTSFNIKDDHIAKGVYPEFPQSDEDLVCMGAPSQPQQIPNLVGPN